jgi:hypothetical protein
MAEALFQYLFSAVAIGGFGQLTLLKCGIFQSELKEFWSLFFQGLKATCPQLCGSNASEFAIIHDECPG